MPRRPHAFGSWLSRAASSALSFIPSLFRRLGPVVIVAAALVLGLAAVTGIATDVLLGLKDHATAYRLSGQAAIKETEAEIAEAEARNIEAEALKVAAEAQVIEAEARNTEAEALKVAAEAQVIEAEARETRADGVLADARLSTEIRETREAAITTPLPMHRRAYDVTLAKIERALMTLDPAYFQPGTNIETARRSISNDILSLLKKQTSDDVVNQAEMAAILGDIRPVLNAHGVIDDQELRQRLVISALSLRDLRINVRESRAPAPSD